MKSKDIDENRRVTYERNKGKSVQQMSVLNVVDRVETKYPFVRKFGEASFDPEKYAKDLLKDNGEQDLK